MLSIRPIGLRAANAYVDEVHRHHGSARGHKFSVACYDGERLVGVAIVGRPVARALDDGFTVEVNRLATDGTPNACSMLYGAAWRAWKAMGGRRIVTYILDTEPGTSLKAAGWTMTAAAAARPTGWNSQAREREVAEHNAIGKQRWERTA